VNVSERAVGRKAAWIRGRAARVSALVSILALAGVSAAVASSTTTIRSTNNAKYGRILEGPSRFSLYVFCPGTSTNCTGTSSSKWPPLTASGRVVAASGSQIKQSKLSTRKLRNGKHQVTYYGQPLYLYKGDTRPGQTNGENKYSGNGAWFLISTAGRAIPPPGY
jgi:predicted lipoprotein with Yx(FWY)xxD motif